MHVPLMIRGKIAILFSIRLAVRLANPKSITVAVPWKPASAGKHTQSLTELLDLYRTLTSLAGLPADDIESNVDGVDVSIPACASRRPASFIGRSSSAPFVPRPGEPAARRSVKDTQDRGLLAVLTLPRQATVSGPPGPRRQPGQGRLELAWWSA